MRFKRDMQTGAVTVDKWDDTVLWSFELLEDMSSDIGTVDGDMIRLSVGNGTAEYRIVERNEQHGRARAVLEECTWRCPTSTTAT